MVNYYQILGISESATTAEIKSAFKKKAVLYHPDKNPGDEAMEELFKEVNRAYQVLNNPYEKARYDLQLKYGAISQQFYEDVPNPPPPRPAAYYRYKEPVIDYRENWIATAYAFGFTLIVAILVMTFIKIKSYYDEQQLAQLLGNRRATFEQVEAKYASGNLKETLILLDQLGGFYRTESDMVRFKKNVFNKIIYDGQQHFHRSEYTSAIYYFEILQEFGTSPLKLRENLAIAYKLTNQPQKSVKVFTELMVEGYSNIYTYMQLADIHENQLSDFDLASNYYGLAKNLALEYYKSIYGDAYIVVLHSGNVPKLHYDLYTRLANIHLKTGHPEKAIDATRWNIEIWPDSVENYLIAGSGYEALKNYQKACESFQIANSLLSSVEIPGYCQ